MMDPVWRRAQLQACYEFEEKRRRIRLTAGSVNSPPSSVPVEILTRDGSSIATRDGSAVVART